MSNASNQPIAMIFLCAGASRRMGSSKALLPWGGETIVAHHWNQFRKLPAFDPWIVTQKTDLPLTDELDRIGWPVGRCTVNPVAPGGDMMDSIRCGVRGCLDTDCMAVGIALIDQPLILPETFQALEKAVCRNPEQIIQPEYKGRRGHPVILPRPVAENLKDSTAATLKDFLSGYDALRASVDVDDRGILTDLDTPESYKTHLPLTA